MRAMRRLLRMAFNAFTVLSLVLALLVAGLWVRSYYYDDFAAALRRDDASARVAAFDAVSTAGRVSVLVQFASLDGTSPARWVERPLTLTSTPSMGRPARQKWTDFPTYSTQSTATPADRHRPARTYHQTLVNFHLWHAVLLTGIAPATWVLHRTRQRRRSTDGQCPACGYDLRATPDRCPECGRRKGGDEKGLHLFR